MPGWKHRQGCGGSGKPPSHALQVCSNAPLQVRRALVEAASLSAALWRAFVLCWARGRRPWKVIQPVGSSHLPLSCLWTSISLGIVSRDHVHRSSFFFPANRCVILKQCIRLARLMLKALQPGWLPYLFCQLKTSSNAGTAHTHAGTCVFAPTFLIMQIHWTVGASFWREQQR